MLLRKTNFTSLKVPPFVLFKILKVWFQPPKPVQPVLKPVQPVLVLFTLPPLLWPVWQSELSEKSEQIFFWNRLSRILTLLSRFWNRSSVRLSRPVDRDPPGRNRFNRFLPSFSQRLPAFGGSFIYPLTHSLSFTSASPTNLWLTNPQTRAFTSPLTPAIASPSIIWRTLGVRWTRSNTLLISSRFSYSLCSWARCKLNLVQICYSWNLVFLDG